MPSKQRSPRGEDRPAISNSLCNVFELRRYTLVPGRRDDLIELFERELVESQEDVGMRIVGTFRDRDRDDMFVWLRGFPDMETRLAALTAFYSGPVWRQHREAANATMVDVDNVLLLRATDPAHPFPDASGARPAVGAAPGKRVVEAHVYLHAPDAGDLVDWLTADVPRVLERAFGVNVVTLRTEPSDNTFAALPVRADDTVFVWLAAFDDETQSQLAHTRLGADPEWTDVLQPRLEQRLLGQEFLRLEPTGRSAFP